MSCAILDSRDIGTWKYIVTHVFCPLQLPGRDDHNINNDHSLARAIATAAHLYSDYISEDNALKWHCISRMLDNLEAITQSERLDSVRTISQFSSMDAGGKISKSPQRPRNLQQVDVIALLIRAQNSGVIFRKQNDVTIFESFEVSPMAKHVMATQGRLICSYPGPAIEIPNLMFDDKNFLSELINFLACMNDDDLEQSSSFKDAVHPRYITELLTGILRSVGRPADIARINKRVGDDVVCNDLGLRPWRRSSLWLLIRVALQTTIDRSFLGNHTYKEFMLFFMCCLAKGKPCLDLSNDLLHFMSAKISRRLRKLGSSAPDRLSRTVLETCTSLRSTIEDRWSQVQSAHHVSPLWNKNISQLDLTRDTKLSLLGSRDYLHNTLANRNASLPAIPFSPSHPPRGTLEYFLSSDKGFLEEAYHIEPYITLYDVERAVEQGIDTWVDRVTNNDEACVALETLADKYSSRALETYANNPELFSVMLLTTIELWVALDKIAIKEIPMLADYSPEVPTSLLENLLLCKATSLLRLRRAHEYLSHRQSRSRSQWSVFSSKITADSFSVRFYRKSSYLQRLKTRFEDDKKVTSPRKITKQEEMDVYSVSGLEAQVVIFELACPVSFNVWRAATVHLLVDLCSPKVSIPRQQDMSRIWLLGESPGSRPYFVQHPRSRITLSGAYHSECYTGSDYYDPSYVIRIWKYFIFDTHTGIPVSQLLGRSDSGGNCTYKLPNGPYHDLQKFVRSTSHTSNEVIANQAECHMGLSIHEYMAFGHLRSGGLLQWLNILRELRGRSLSFRCQEVHMLLAQAVSQVGPLANKVSTWHREIREPTFCYALLGELQSLIRDVEASWLEVVTMDTVSFILRRLLASSPDQAVTLKALGLLRTLRGKVFSWIQELLAELARTPADQGLRGILRDTSATCRSTFDVDPPMIPELLYSAEDIEVLLSSAILIHDHTPSDVSRLPVYSQLLLDRDRRLSLVLESVVSDIMQADSSHLLVGINLAIRRVWPGYRPGSKWAPFQAPNSRWFSCLTAPPVDQGPQTVYLNIINGSLLVDGKPFRTWLPNEYVWHPLYKRIFGEACLTMLDVIKSMTIFTANTRCFTK